jgi:hypothetical protein
LRSFALVICLGLSALCAAGTQPPVQESVDLRLVTLNRLELEPVAEPRWGLLPLRPKDLPRSVQPYLKPSRQLDHLHRQVQKAAAMVRRAVAPGAAQKDRLRDAALVAQALREWLDVSLPLDRASDWGRQAALDHREAWPKASAILMAGKADEDGRALAAVALLRALKVPARVAWARGHLAAQYWSALAAGPKSPLAKRPKGKLHAASKAPQPPLGQWRLLDPALDDWDVDAWSLDAGDLARLTWRPQEELTALDEGWERQAFAAGDSLAAHAAFADALALGHLSPTASAQALSPLAAASLRGLTQGSATLWVLSIQRWRLQTLGALSALDPIELTTPYRPQLASWGRERRGSVRALELEAQGVWSDREPRLKRHSGSLADVWSSPPPALGVLHAYRLSLRRPASVLQAQWQGDEVRGVLLRADNLSPRQGWVVKVDAGLLTGVSQVLTVKDDGSFVAALSPTSRSLFSLDLTSSGDEKADFQRLSPEKKP